MYVAPPRGGNGFVQLGDSVSERKCVKKCFFSLRNSSKVNAATGWALKSNSMLNFPKFFDMYNIMSFQLID